MLGNNKLILNQRSLREAVEFWLKNKIMKSETFMVTSVKQKRESTGMQGLDDVFEIELQETDPIDKNE